MGKARTWTKIYLATVAAVILGGICFVSVSLTKEVSSSPGSEEFAGVHREVMEARFFDSVDPGYGGNSLNRFFYARRASNDENDLRTLIHHLEAMGWHPFWTNGRDENAYIKLCRNKMTAEIERRTRRDNVVELVASFGWAPGSQGDLPSECRSSQEGAPPRPLSSPRHS